MSKHAKKLTFVNEKRKPSKKDDLSKYRKIYKIYQEKTCANTSDNRLTIQREKEKINKLKSLFGISKNTNLLEKQQKKWENLTKPKLPFSKRTILPKDARLKKLQDLKPSSLYHNNYMINWIRNKYSLSVIEKSLNHKLFFPKIYKFKIKSNIIILITKCIDINTKIYYFTRKK